MDIFPDFETLMLAEAFAPTREPTAEELDALVDERFGELYGDVLEQAQAEAYEEALEEARRRQWQTRRRAEGMRYDIDPTLYDDERDFEFELEVAREDAREEAIRRKWQARRQAEGTALGVNPEYYDDEDDFEDALEEAIRRKWQTARRSEGAALGVNPEEYDDEDDFEDALEQARQRQWQDARRAEGAAYGVDPEEYDDEDDFNDDLASAMAERLRGDSGAYARYGVNPEQSADEDERAEALEQAIREALCGRRPPDAAQRPEQSERPGSNWRDVRRAEGLRSGLDTAGFADEAAFDAALAAAQGCWRDDCGDTEALAAELGVYPANYPTKTAYERAFAQAEAAVGILRDEQGTVRQYAAAKFLYQMRHAPDAVRWQRLNRDIAGRCEFILHSGTVAGRYLTMYKGFLFAQAAKENFTLPIEVPDEDGEPLTYVRDLLLELAEADAALAVEVWRWLIAEFGPYQAYMQDFCTPYNDLLIHIDDFPPEFMRLTAHALGSDPAFAAGLLTNGPAFPASKCELLAVEALADGAPQEAGAILRAILCNPRGLTRDLREIVRSFVIRCRLRQITPEAMRAFLEQAVPSLHQIESARAQRVLPELAQEAAAFAASAREESDAICIPCRITAETTGQSAAAPDAASPAGREAAAAPEDARREIWRAAHRAEALRFGIDPHKFEEEAALLAAIDAARTRARQAQEAQRRVDAQDTAQYRVCGVQLAGSAQVYNYRTDDATIDIGDRVVVPVGKNGMLCVAEVLSVCRCRRIASPYPIDKMKPIAGRYAPPPDSIEPAQAGGDAKGGAPE